MFLVGSSWARTLRALALVLATVAGALHGSTPASAGPLALIADVIGDAELAGQPLKLLVEVEPGRDIALQAGASVVVFYLADGVEWTLRGPGSYRLASRGPEARDGAPPAQRRPGPPGYRDLKLRTDRLVQGGLVLRSRDRFTLVTPVNELVLSSELRFAWESLEEGVRYQFELVDQAGQKLLAAETTDTELRLPLAIALKPGQPYFWAVRGHAPGAAQPVYRAAEFRMADTATRRRLEAARPKDTAPFAERALFIALLEDAGARSAAAAERARLAPERPAGWAPAK